MSIMGNVSPSTEPAHKTSPAPTTTPTSATPAPTTPPYPAPPTVARNIALAALLVWLAPALALEPLVLEMAVALFRRLDTLLAPEAAALDSELSTLESADVAEDSAEDAPEAALVAALEAEDASVDAALVTELAPETMRGVSVRRMVEGEAGDAYLRRTPGTGGRWQRRPRRQSR
ncbi:hypothetical protein TRAPUB_8956 [Trametes pubescens]|uniref:Uncharacterized protein n=1 Tax=Trametes pubescens TaxID=154538 RepID=A0A1M2W403_TRAPU|nr:hypothetical protein TRAPUB_8956 [Trametes pubescens]